jgi:hypothetical protein
MKPTQDPAKNGTVLVRTFDSALSGPEVRKALDQALENTPELSTCYIHEKRHDDLIHLGGTELIGTIRLVLYNSRKGHHLEAAFRRGDRPMFERLIKSLGEKVTARAKPGKEAEEHALLDFIQGMPGIGGKHSPIIASSALDAALDCQFDETEQLIEFFFRLTNAAHKLSHPNLFDDDEALNIVGDRTDRKAMRIYHEGKRYTLWKEDCLLGTKYDCHLKIHFAWLPDKKRFLIGWFTESEYLFTD